MSSVTVANSSHPPDLQRAPHLLMEEGFRWFGPPDPVPLAHIRQTGATAIFTALHDIPYGEVWPLASIRERQRLIENAGLRWAVVESVPIHEAIKIGSADADRCLENYRRTLANLGAAGIDTVVTNFMPVLDWVRTEFRHQLPDGSECLRFDPVRFAAFEICALQRPGAESEYSTDQIARARTLWASLDPSAQTDLVNGVIDVFPGCKLGLTLDDVREMLAAYDGIDRTTLKSHLKRFLDAVLPAAESAGIRLALHPDDPPFPVLGLPRILSTAADIADVVAMNPSPANGICFCTGSFGMRADNDLAAMVREFGPRIHAVHLRNTQREPDGSFHESDHLGGSADLAAVVHCLLAEQDRRHREDRSDTRLVLRPDHGHTMLDDLEKPLPITPGYSAIGRLRGLAELRGLQVGLRSASRFLTPPTP